MDSTLSINEFYQRKYMNNEYVYVNLAFYRIFRN